MAHATITVNGTPQAQLGVEGTTVELHGMTSQVGNIQSAVALAATLIVQSQQGLSKGHYILKLYDKDGNLADKQTFDSSVGAYAVGSNDSYGYGADISPSFGGAQSNAFNMDPVQFSEFKIELSFAGKMVTKGINVNHAGGSTIWNTALDGNGSATLSFNGTVT